MRTETLSEDEMLQRYKKAVEDVLPRLPVKNAVIDIASIWAETSIPQELLQEIVAMEDLDLPDNVKRITTDPELGVPHGKQSARNKRRSD